MTEKYKAALRDGRVGRPPTFTADEQVVIRTYRAHGMTLRDLADRFGGSKDAISRVVGTRVRDNARLVA